MDSIKQRIRVLMLPFIAHGHISPFLELAKRLSRRNFHILLCSTPASLSPIKNKISEKDSLSIQLIELHLPSLPELPPHYHTSNGLPPHLNHLLPKVLKLGEPNFSEILQKLQPDLLIHDTLVLWAGPIASRLNIPAISFYTSGPAAASYFLTELIHPGKEFPFPAIRLTDFELDLAMKDLKPGGSHETGPESPDDEIKDEINDAPESPDDEIKDERNDTIMLANSCRVIDWKYMDYITELIGWKILPVGVLVQEPNLGDGDDNELDWLGEKDELSTVFVSFGSEYFLKKEDIEEIAYGLELGKVNFIWVIRFPKGDEMRVEEVLPEGFLQRVGERGRILEKWAPQAKILRHSSVGGFVSHCGWNSMLESIDIGVPIIGMPMHSDQPVNVKLAVELGVGVEVKRDVEDKYRREEISRVIKYVFFEESGKDLRTKTGEQREIIRPRSREELDGAVQKMREICGKNQDA